MITQEHEQTREAWNKIAVGYDEFVTHTEVWLANEALKRAKLSPGERFLDVGGLRRLESPGGAPRREGPCNGLVSSNDPTPRGACAQRGAL